MCFLLNYTKWCIGLNNDKTLANSYRILYYYAYFNYVVCYNLFFCFLSFNCFTSFSFLMACTDGMMILGTFIAY